MMKKMSDLPRDLEEEVLSRVPLTSLIKVRSTCKNWSTLSKDRSFAKKHLDYQAKLAAEAKEFMVVLRMRFRVYLMRVNLHKSVESCIKREGKLIGIGDGSDEVDVAQVFHCDGLVLCSMKANRRLVVWNPYLGQTRWLESSFKYSSYALGYDKSSKSRRHKVLEFFVDYFFFFKIYDSNSDSWRVLDVTPDQWVLYSCDHGVSLEGNTYWVARDLGGGDDDAFLVCFDFTRETFGPGLLPLPLEWFPYGSDHVALSSVREEKLAVLIQRWDSLEIWITTKIGPNAVSWNSKVFLQVNPRHLLSPAEFFIDEEKKVGVVFDENRPIIVGVDGSFKEAHLGECAYGYCYSRVCSYVPSLVQLN